jgi:putative component of membrane protein insertase Oxa1/YidC/SpoIIIJ protein YidD
MILALLIRVYRMNPWRPDCRCRPHGPSCSEIGLRYAHVKGAWLLALTLLFICEADGHPLKQAGQQPLTRRQEKGITRARQTAEMANGRRGSTYKPLRYPVKLPKDSGMPHCKECNVRVPNHAPHCKYGGKKKK